MHRLSNNVYADFKNHISIIIHQYHFFNMKNKLAPTYLLLVIAPLFFGCGATVKEENKNSARESSVSPEHVSGEKYIIDTKETVLTWEGSMVFGFEEEHKGYVYVSKGELNIYNDQLVGGAADIDMNTMEYGDKENKNTPIKHLKSPDYFDVEKFPASTFSITRVAYEVRGNIKVTGDLTIKGVTNAVYVSSQNRS